MQENPVWLAPLLYAGLLAGSGAGLWYGWNRLEAYRDSSEQELLELQQQQRTAQEEAAARTRLMLSQTEPFMIAGTIAMTGLGMVIMLKGMRRERRRRERMIEEYYGED